MNWVSILRQKPVVLIDKVGLVNASSSFSKAIPCIGQAICAGMIYASQPVTLTVEQGVNDTSGALTYRYTETFALLAGGLEKIEIPIVGKFIKATITNSGLVASSVECFLVCRGI